MSPYGVKLERSTPLRLDQHPASIGAAWPPDNCKDRPTAVDLFSGAGGLSLGLELAGFDVILAVDHDPVAVETHAHNFRGASVRADLSGDDILVGLIEALKAVRVDLVAGGPPCQPFSRAGRSKIRSLVAQGARPESDDRKLLWQSFLRIVESVLPRAVLLENVPDMALGDDLQVVRVIADRLERIGYDVDYQLVDAWKHGVPQHRQRFILVATRGASFDWPSQLGEITLREAIGDLPKLGRTSGAPVMPYRTLPTTDFQRQARGDMTEAVVFDHVTRPVRPDDHAAFELMTSKTRYSDLPEHLRRYRADIFDDKYKRLAWSERSRSITAHIAKDGYWYIHPSEHRTLTVREAARIQTFPDHFRFAGSRSDQFRQIGNAVPPALGKAIGASIRSAWEAPPGGRSVDQRSSLRQRIVEWSKLDELASPWRYSVDPWQVTVGTLLGANKRMSIAPSPQHVLNECPRPVDIGDADWRKLQSLARTDAARRALRRIRAVARTVARLGPEQSWDEVPWLRAGNVAANEELHIRCLGFGEDLLLTGSSTARVVSRLLSADDPAALVNRRLSEGRLAVSQVVGTGSDSTRINAALLGIAIQFCKPQQPVCGRCPMREVCVTARLHASSTAEQPPPPQLFDSMS